MTDTPETERLDFAAGANSAETIRAGLVETLTMIDATLDAQRRRWNQTRPLHDDPSITFEAAMYPDGSPAGAVMLAARASALLGLAVLQRSPGLPPQMVGPAPYPRPGGW